MTDLTDLSKDDLYARLDQQQKDWDRTYRRRADEALQVAWALDDHPENVDVWMTRFRRRDAEHKAAHAEGVAIQAEIDRRADR